MAGARTAKVTDGLIVAVEDEIERVETLAVYHGDNGDTVFRRHDDEGVWVKPKLDGDGEVHLPLPALGAALRVLGFNRADLFPDG